jgi:hypothetical protein
VAETVSGEVPDDGETEKPLVLDPPTTTVAVATVCCPDEQATELLEHDALLIKSSRAV